MASLHFDFYKGTDLYSDGDIENEILAYLKTAGNDTEQVFGKDMRWPVFYYLSHIRENILSWYEFKPGATVLEIGAGFGAITGLLCDWCASVTAVELSKRRAQGLYERHKDRQNLDIMVGNFNDMEFSHGFDYITLIGVLEYAVSFTDSDRPFEDFLKQIRRLLNPGGRLLIAIENRFGLKYWCGAAEDHTGNPFDGVNGYEGIDFVKTFSRAELTQLLEASGYAYSDFYYPYPDYKLPQAIYSDRCLPDSYNAGKFREFYLEPKLFTAQERRIIGDIAKNGVFPFFSNSFFVEAAAEPPSETARRVNAAFLTYDRKAEYRVGTLLFDDGTVLKFPAEKQADAHLLETHENCLRLAERGVKTVAETMTERGIVTPFCRLETLDRMLCRMAEAGDRAGFIGLLDLFFENILRSSEILSGEGVDALLARGYTDMILSNCFYDDGELLFFDQEWSCEQVTAGFVLYRALTHLFLQVQDEALKREVYAHFGITERHIAGYETTNQEFNDRVMDPVIVSYFAAHTFRYSKKIGQLLADRDQKIYELERNTAELNRQNADLERLYLDTQSFANGLLANPALLGKRRILKGLIQCFCPGFVKRAGRRVLTALRTLKRRILGRGTDYEQFLRRERARIRRLPDRTDGPLISILVPLYNTDRRMLREMILSVLNQTYRHFELCLADASDDAHSYVFETASAFALKDKRIKLVKLEKNLGISGNTNACRRLAAGEYIALLDHDDLLIKNALDAVVRTIETVNPDVMYSDEDHLREGRRCMPFFKPDFNRDLLYTQMYICHFLCFKAGLYDAAGGMRDDFSGSQDYDLMLRLTEQTDKIHHIPEVLYSWRETATSTSINPDSKPYAHHAGRQALDAHLKRRYGSEAHADDGAYPFVYDARYGLPEQKPTVSVIIPTKDHPELLEDCVNSILEKTVYPSYEILILNNNSEETGTFACFERLHAKDNRVRVLDATFGFNWSKLNNFGIDNSSGDVFIFLNNDTRIISPDWMERLAENALRPDVGVVGALLLYEDDTIQHAGVVAGMNGWADHIYKGLPQVHAADRFVSPMVSRDVVAVTGACMAVSRETIGKVGRFDESFMICGSDVELCVRAWHNGLNVLYDANVRLYHFESKSRDATNIPQIDFVRSEELYREFREHGDPFYNRNLDPNSTTPKIRS